MTPERVFSWSNRWFSASLGAVAGLAVSAIVIGFVFLPYATPGSQLAGIWDAICSAAGVPRETKTSSTAEPAVITSPVVMNSDMSNISDARSVGRGATLALQCAICHGSGRPGQIDTPSLDGQPIGFLYKQLRDFNVGARSNAVMSPFAARLVEQDMLDLAAYYSYLPPQPGPHPDATISAPSIVTLGAPMRNIPACSSCHGGPDAKGNAPSLSGQSAIYLTAQLQAFAKGARHNDISLQMRNVARQMTLEEIAAASRYYASRH